MMTKKTITTILVMFCTYAFGYLASSGTGFFISDSYVVTASHTINTKPYSCILDLGDSSCYPVQVVVNNEASDLAVLKIKSSAKKFNHQACHVATYDVDEGTTLWTYGFDDPLHTRDTTMFIDKSNVSFTSGYDDDYDTYRINIFLKHGYSGGPSFDATGRVVGISRAISTIETDVSMLIKSSLLVDLLAKYKIENVPTTKNGRKCTFIVINSNEYLTHLHN